MKKLNEEKEQATILERVKNLIITNAEEHKQLLFQVMKTNGTVADIQRWRFIATGIFLAVNAIVVPILIAFVLKLFIY